MNQRNNQLESKVGKKGKRPWFKACVPRDSSQEELWFESYSTLIRLKWGRMKSQLSQDFMIWVTLCIIWIVHSHSLYSSIINCDSNNTQYIDTKPISRLKYDTITWIQQLSQWIRQFLKGTKTKYIRSKRIRLQVNIPNELQQQWYNNNANKFM